MAPRNIALLRVKNLLRSLRDRGDAFDDDDKVKSAAADILRRTFRYFKLNPAEQSDRDLLLSALAFELFRDRGVGRRKGTLRWDGPRLFGLENDYHTVIREEPNLSDVKAAKKIKERFKKDYEDTSEEMIRQRLPEARRLVKESIEHSLLQEQEWLKIMEKEEQSGLTEPGGGN